MAAPRPACGHHVLKLAVNSHVAYSRPLHCLFDSLLATGFSKLDDVLVLLGGSQVDAGPRHVPLAAVAPRAGLRANVTVLRTRANAIDYHGLALIHRHRKHPLVRAETYLYVHDTVTFAADFVRRFESFRLRKSARIFTTWPLPNSNVVAFGADVIARFRTNFDGDIAKRDAFPMEFGYSLPRRNATEVRPLVAFGVVVKLGPRCPNGSVDIYATGTPRMRFWYPAFGLYKYSRRSDAAGDILGSTTSLFGGRRYKPPRGVAAPRVLFGTRPECWGQCQAMQVHIPGSRTPLQLPNVGDCTTARSLKPRRAQGLST